MIATLRSNRRIQLAAGLFIGICFGFLLQRGGVTRYEVVIGQLLLQDFPGFFKNGLLGAMSRQAGTTAGNCATPFSAPAWPCQGVDSVMNVGNPKNGR
jgi:hypothetical protein